LYKTTPYHFLEEGDDDDDSGGDDDKFLRFSFLKEVRRKADAE
jgi:hypothetical protein